MSERAHCLDCGHLAMAHAILVGHCHVHGCGCQHMRTTPAVGDTPDGDDAGETL